MPGPELDGVIVALNAGADPDTGLSWADGIIFSPVKLAAWRNDLALSVLIYFSEVTGYSDLTVEIEAVFDGRVLDAKTHRLERDPASAHHWAHLRIAFPATHPGSYVISGQVSFGTSPPLPWRREVVVQKE